MTTQPADSYESRLRAVLGVVQRYLPPDGIGAKEALSEITALVIRNAGAPAGAPSDKYAQRYRWLVANHLVQSPGDHMNPATLRLHFEQFEPGVIGMGRSLDAAIDAAMAAGAPTEGEQQ